MQLKKILVSAAILMLLTLISFFTLRALSPELLGSDSYFILSQGKFLADNGSLKVPDRGLNYLIAAVFLKVGVAEEDAVRLTQAVILTLIIAVILLFLHSRSRRSLVLDVLLVASISPLVFFHAIEFPKLTLASSIFVAALAVRKQVGFSLALAIASFALHPGLFPFALGYVFFQVQHLSWRFRSIVGVSFIIAALLLLNSTRGQDILLALADQPPAIATFFFRPEISIILRFECAVLLLALGASSFFCIRARKYKHALAGLVLLALLLPTAAGEPFGLGERYLVLCALFALPLIALQWLRTDYFQARPMALPSLTALAIGIGAISSIYTLPRYDYGSIKNATAFLRNKPEKMVIARKPLKFYYTAMTGRDSFSFTPEADWDVGSISRVAIGIDRDEFVYYAGEVCPWGSGLIEKIPGTTWIWMKEPCWQDLTKRVTKDLDPDLYRRIHDEGLNPSQSRPRFLRERRYLQSRN